MLSFHIDRANMKKWKELAEQTREAVEEELRIDVNKRRDSLIQIGEEDSDDNEKSDITKLRESILEEVESIGSGTDDGNPKKSGLNESGNKFEDVSGKNGDDTYDDLQDSVSTDEEVRELVKDLHSWFYR